MRIKVILCWLMISPAAVTLSLARNVACDVVGSIPFNLILSRGSHPVTATAPSPPRLYPHIASQVS